MPINTSRRHFSPTSHWGGLHVMDAFAGATCRVIQTALASRYKVRVYTYCDEDLVSWKMERSKLQKLQVEYPKRLLDSTIKAFDKRLPYDVF